MHGQYERLLLLCVLTFLIRSTLHDPEVFSDPMEYRPERFLKDGKLNSDVMDSQVTFLQQLSRSLQMYRQASIACG